MQHGEGAAAEIKRGITFYANLFKESTRFEWKQVVRIAAGFESLLRRDWPHYLEEIRGEIGFSLPVVLVYVELLDSCNSQPAFLSLMANPTH